MSYISAFPSFSSSFEYLNIYRGFYNISHLFKKSTFAIMKKIAVKKVETQEEMEDFVTFANKMYADCPYYVPELEMDVYDTFNPQKNPGLEFSDIQSFIAINENGRVVGRIAGIINHRANKKWQTHNVRFGYFDFNDDIAISKALLEAVEEWGKERGMETIQGPMGITDFDKEGMLIEDFDLMGTMNTLYNYPYYPIHMGKLGYNKEVDWIQIRIEIPKETPKRYARVAKYSKEMFGVKIKKPTHKEISQQGYGLKIFHLLNEAYAPLFGFTSLSEKQIELFTKQYLKLIDMHLITLVENSDDELVGAAISMRSLSKALRKTKGKLFPYGWFHLLKALTWQPANNAELLLIAVRPDYQMLGVNALFFDDLIPVYNKYGIQWGETGPQLENNVRELTQWKPMNPTFVKRRRCFRKSII